MINISGFGSKYEDKLPHTGVISKILYKTTGIFSSSQVVLGKDNWLFYSSRNDGDSIADYTGTNNFSEEYKTSLLYELGAAQSVETIIEVLMSLRMLDTFSPSMSVRVN